jgi:hypothetical protein
MSTQLKQGFNLVGVLAGAVQNSNNTSYYNLGINIVTQNEFGTESTDTKRLGLTAANHERLANKINQYKGKLVTVNCEPRAVDGRNGSFLSLDTNQNTDILLIESEK